MKVHFREKYRNFSLGGEGDLIRRELGGGGELIGRGGVGRAPHPNPKKILKTKCSEGISNSL